MGTRLIQQRRGKGTSTYRSPSYRFVGSINYPSTQDKLIRGEVIELINCPGHSAPLAYLEWEDGQSSLVPAVLGLRVGQAVQTGPGAKPELGSIVMLKDVPAGTSISSIERTPGGDSKLVRTSGSDAKIMDKEEGKVIIKLPSRKKITLNERCRALIGQIAGGERKNKPFMTAGKKAKAKRAKNKLYPIVKGVAMNACDHPFGGTHRRTKGRSKSTSKNAPAGRKVGAIASKRTGRKKR